jgi:hypothetical protein
MAFADASPSAQSILCFSSYNIVLNSLAKQCGRHIFSA